MKQNMSKFETIQESEKILKAIKTCTTSTCKECEYNNTKMCEHISNIDKVYEDNTFYMYIENVLKHLKSESSNIENEKDIIAYESLKEISNVCTFTKNGCLGCKFTKKEQEVCKLVTSYDLEATGDLLKYIVDILKKLEEQKCLNLQ